MCISFIFINPDLNGKYRLIILNNRDEFIDRPTSELEWRNGILSGIDELDPAKGTWLGINKDGKVGNLLSITQPGPTKKGNAPSRGVIPSNFLKSSQSAKEYCDDLTKTSANYNGFQFLALDRSADNLFDLYSVTSLFVDQVETVCWPRGNMVISNSPPNKPYGKVKYGEKRFQAFTDTLTDNMTPEDIITKLMEIGSDRTSTFPDSQYQLQSAFADSYYKSLCSIFIRFPQEMNVRYGTRSHSIIIVDNQENVTYYEKRISECPDIVENAKWSEKTETFKLNPIA